jgi:pilus assembly protein CpaD
MSKPATKKITAPLCLFASLLVMAGCKTPLSPAVTGSAYPNDYRERHPIRFDESERSIQLLVGSGRGELTGPQRAQVTALGSAWRRESTGLIVIDMPKGTRNERAARYAVQEAQSLLRATGVPARAVRVRKYEPPQTSDLGPVRISYARIEATTGPCGEWPEDLGVMPSPSLTGMPSSIDNRPSWNHGCATQKNLASMVANPEDLMQPRPETPPLAARRQTVMDKYRKGEDPATIYTNGGDGKVSTVGSK